MSNARAFWNGFFTGFGPGALFAPLQLNDIDRVFLPESEKITETEVAAELLSDVFKADVYKPGVLYCYKQLSETEEEVWMVQIADANYLVTRIGAGDLGTAGARHREASAN